MTTRPVLIMAGGTGGHVYPALAVADYLSAMNIPVMWMGSKVGMEAKVVALNGYKLFTIDVKGIRGRGLARYLFTPLMIVRSVYQSIKIILDVKPVAVLGMGGYASGPGGVAALLTFKPLLIHEQNSVAGLTNRLLAPYAKVIMQGFPGSFKHSKKTHHTGNPVRRDFINSDLPGTGYSSRDTSKLNILILGGSQGARVLNEVMPEAIKLLSKETRVEIRHQSGTHHFENTKRLYENVQRDDRIEVMPFIEDMLSVYTWADLVVCRAGAMTLAEICILGRASILIPYPFAVDDHQTRNGQYLMDIGGCRMIQEKDCNAELMAELIDEYYKDPEKLKEMAVSSRSLAKPDATETVGKLCMEFVHA